MDELLCILEKITYWIDEVKDLVVLHHFQTLVDLFRGAQQRGDCAITVLSAFIRSCELSSVNDFQLANQVRYHLKQLYIIKAMESNAHESRITTALLCCQISYNYLLVCLKCHLMSFKL